MKWVCFGEIMTSKVGRNERYTFTRYRFHAAVWMIALLCAHDLSADPACPSPSVPQGQQCVLRGDAVLTDTMWIPSGTKLNCKGYSITPAMPGALDDPRTVANEFVASRPDLAMFVYRAYDVKIQNCIISGFDFGIIVAQSKTADASEGVVLTPNKILGNTIDVRTNAIDVIQSDRVIISDNRVTFASERGRGVVVDYDSDDNLITGNTITSTDAASTGLVRQLPGGPLVTNANFAIWDNEIHCLGYDKPLQNFVVSGVLFQIPANDPNSDFEDSGRSDHNVIEGNDVIDIGGGPSCTLDPDQSCRSNADCVGKGPCLLKQNSGVGFNSRAADTIVRGNRISGRMARGVSFGGQTNAVTIAGWITGTCSQDPLRICSSTNDCNIQGYDAVSKGICENAVPATYNGNTRGLIAEDNTLSGEYDTAALFAGNTDGFTFRRNIVAGGLIGVSLSSGAINGLMERNVVSGVSVALSLAFNQNFTQTIRLNDFTDYSVAVRTTNNFTVPTDIATDTGNYWGLECPGFNAGLVFFDNGAENPNVIDGKAFGEPVARTPDASLPPRCQ